MDTKMLGDIGECREASRGHAAQYIDAYRETPIGRIYARMIALAMYDLERASSVGQLFGWRVDEGIGAYDWIFGKEAEPHLSAVIDSLGGAMEDLRDYARGVIARRCGLGSERRDEVLGAALRADAQLMEERERARLHARYLRASGQEATG